MREVGVVASSVKPRSEFHVPRQPIQRADISQWSDTRNFDIGKVVVLQPGVYVPEGAKPWWASLTNHHDYCLVPNPAIRHMLVDAV